jgi:hypothetical protein
MCCALRTNAAQGRKYQPCRNRAQKGDTLCGTHRRSLEIQKGLQARAEMQALTQIPVIPAKPVSPFPVTPRLVPAAPVASVTPVDAEMLAQVISNLHAEQQAQALAHNFRPTRLSLSFEEPYAVSPVGGWLAALWTRLKALVTPHRSMLP